jgi:hypothetical protein
MASGTTASSRRPRSSQEPTLSVPGPYAASCPWRCFGRAWHAQVLTAVGGDLVDDTGTGLPHSAGGAVPDPRAWDHIPPCGSDDLAVSVRWERAGVGLAGQILVENVGGRTCRLSEKPWVVPLGADGRELPVEVFLTADARLRPVILAPGERAAAPSGGLAGAAIRRPGSRGSIGSAARPLSRLRDPANRTAPTPGSRRTFRRLGSTPWTDRPARRAAHEDVGATAQESLRTICG